MDSGMGLLSIYAGFNKGRNDGLLDMRPKLPFRLQAVNYCVPAFHEGWYVQITSTQKNIKHAESINHLTKGV